MTDNENNNKKAVLAVGSSLSWLTAAMMQGNTAHAALEAQDSMPIYDISTDINRREAEREAFWDEHAQGQANEYTKRPLTAKQSKARAKSKAARKSRKRNRR